MKTEGLLITIANMDKPVKVRKSISEGNNKSINKLLTTWGNFNIAPFARSGYLVEVKKQEMNKYLKRERKIH